MGDVLALRIVAHEPRPEVDAREARTLYRESRDLFVVQSRVERHRFEARTALAEILDAWNVARLDELQPGQALQGRVDIGNLLGNELELVGRQVFREHAPLAVEYQPADGRHRFDPDPVTERTLREVLVLDNLQLDETRNDESEQEDAEHARQNDAPEKDASF